MPADFWTGCRTSVFSPVMWLLRLRSSESNVSPFWHSESFCIWFYELSLPWTNLVCEQAEASKKIPLILHSCNPCVCDCAHDEIEVNSWIRTSYTFQKQTWFARVASVLPLPLHCCCYLNWVTLTGNWEQSTQSTIGLPSSTCPSPRVYQVVVGRTACYTLRNAISFGIIES